MIFAILLRTGLSLEQILWDSLQYGDRNLSPNLLGVHPRIPSALRVWSTGTLVQNVPNHLTSKSTWRSTGLTQPFECRGFARYGKPASGVFTPPIVSDMNSTCTSLEFRKYLWSDIQLSTTSTCECRKIVSVSARLRGSCLVQPQVGWPGPGLVKCDAKDAPPLVSIKYHPTTGQVRIDGKCLTAFPYSLTQLSNVSENYLPWGVSLADCNNYQNVRSRQSWDFPDGVGTVLTDLNWASADGLGTPSGRVGRVTLRASSDIGMRCLDVAMTPLSVPATFPVAFLEASVCEDARINPGDLGLWSFYMIKNASTQESASSSDPQVPSTDGPYPPWQTCNDNVCSVCSKEDEYRGVWQSVDPASSGPRTDPVSLPTDFTWKAKCDVDTLREVIIPDSIASLSSSCYCQEQPVLIAFNNALKGSPKLKSIMWSGQDDLPPTTST
jgi:hypothetical protein